MSGINTRCDNGLLWTQTTDGEPFCFHPDAIMSAKPNPHAKHVTFLWLKGHRRFTAIDCAIGDLYSWLSDAPAGTTLGTVEVYKDCADNHRAA